MIGYDVFGLVLIIGVCACLYGIYRFKKQENNKG